MFLLDVKFVSRNVTVGRDIAITHSTVFEMPPGLLFEICVDVEARKRLRKIGEEKLFTIKEYLVMRLSCIKMLRSSFLYSFFSALILFALFIAPTAQAQTYAYRIITLGSFGGDTQSFALSDNGSRVTGSSNIGSGYLYHPFLFSRLGAAFSDVGLPAGFDYGWGQAINNSGAILIRAFPRSFIYQNQSFTELLSSSTFNSAIVAEDINNDNKVVGTTAIGNILRAVLWENGVSTDLSDQHGISQALKINDAGEIACVKKVANIDQPCQISNGTLFMILANGPYGGRPYGMNGLGDVVGQSPDASGLNRGFYWTNGVKIILPIQKGLNPLPLAINNCLQIVGRAFTIPGGAENRAFVLHNSQMSDLNSLVPAGTGWVFKEAVDISQQGRILVNGELDGAPRSAILIPNTAATCTS